MCHVLELNIDNDKEEENWIELIIQSGNSDAKNCPIRKLGCHELINWMDQSYNSDAMN